MSERERRLVRNVGQWRIGGEAQHVGTPAVADVVGAYGRHLSALSVVERRPQAYGDARQPSQRLDAANDLRGMEGALEAQETGREISDAHGIAIAVLEHRLDDRSIAHVLGARR